MVKISVKNFKNFLLINKGTKQTIIKNTFWLIGAQVVIKCIAFVLVILLARYLGVEEFGKYSFVITFIAFFGLIADFGLSTLTIRDIARDKDKIKDYLNIIASFKLILALITILLIFITIQFVAKTHDIKVLVYLASIWVVLNSFNQFFIAVFNAYEKMQYEAFIRITEKLIWLGLALIVIFNKMSIVTLFWFYAISSLITLCLTIFLIRTKFTKFSLRWDFKFINAILKGSSFFFLLSVFTIIYDKIDIFMLYTLTSVKEVGIYSASYQLYSLFLMPFSIFVRVLFPMISNKIRDKSIINNLIKLMGISFLISLGFFGIIYIFKGYINLIFNFGPQVSKAFLILSFGYLFIIPASFPYIYLKASKSTLKYLVQIILIAAIINIILNLFLIPTFSLFGAVYATLISQFVFFSMSFIKLISIYLNREQENEVVI